MLEKKFEDILYNSTENETIEFKAAQNNFKIHTFGKYFSGKFYNQVSHLRCALKK